MVRHWMMCFEAKHQYFKRLAASMGNYINLEYSLAYRHQCFLQNNDLLHNTVESGPGKNNTFPTFVPACSNVLYRKKYHVSND